MRLCKGSPIGARRVSPFRMPTNTLKGLPPAPETNPWWWHPGRVGVEMAPSYFAKDLERIDPDLAATHDKLHGKWSIWMKKPTIQTKTCWGWQLLFSVDRLDQRVFARLYESSARKWGNAVEYFRAVEREVLRDRELVDRKSSEYAIERSREVWDYSQIKNIGKGSKFSTYHA